MARDSQAAPIAPTVIASQGTSSFDPSFSPTQTSAGSETPRSAAAGAVTAAGLPERYEDLGRIASGGFGEVRRVHDRSLNRILAMKLLRVEHATRARVRARFASEAALTASLQHPGIVAVHDHGELSDGRLWFTMQEVRGRTMLDVIDELYRARGPDGFLPTPTGFTFRRAVDAFMRIAQAVGYAHRHGVVHRDIKPENLMVGEHGEALVMDWGIARRLRAAPEIADESAPSVHGKDSVEGVTQAGDVLGTLAYMPPEQASGSPELHSPESDVFALGGVLYHLLSGVAPRSGETASMIRQVLGDEPTPLRERATLVPPELVAICERAMQRQKALRYPDASAMADDLVTFLDGSKRREQALVLVHAARENEPQIEALRRRARALGERAEELLEAVRPFDPVERKVPGWELLDEAARLQRDAALAETEWLQGHHGALSIDPDLPEAHAALAAHYRERLIEAERLGHAADAARFEVLLRAHDRGAHSAFLRGEGALSLTTSPSGAKVTLFRYVEQRRRLIPERVEDLGPTPIHARTLPRGSYLCRIEAEGHLPVLYPVLIERDGHWDGVPPGASEPLAIDLPKLDLLSSNELYIPAGFAWLGGDARAADALSSRRVWVDAFAMARHPVTCAEYLAFLNDLVRQGREAEALRACPRSEFSSADADPSHLAFPRDTKGNFVLGGDGGGLSWGADEPVVAIDWHAASAYAAWRSETEGRAYRLPTEVEREKAARGVDGRTYPFGNHFDPTWACVLASHEGAAKRAAVGAYPGDESPYGVRGLAGNVRDFCADLWSRDGTPCQDDDASDTAFRIVRGGAWTSVSDLSRAAARFALRPGQRRPTTGLRLARSLP